MALSSDPHRDAIKAADQTGEMLAQAFANIGTSTSPRGEVLVAYRNALRALRDVLRAEEPSVAAVQEIMGALRSEVEKTSIEIITTTAGLGHDSLKEQIEVYGGTIGPGVDLMTVDLMTMSRASVEATLGIIDQQTYAVMANLVVRGDPGMIVGDASRQGIVRPAPTVRELAHRAAAAFAAPMVMFSKLNGPTGGFKKQAIAARDANTTETCLRVNGQIQPLDQPFQLEGTPRYADSLDWVPFHWWCRTSVALYMEEYDYGLTEEIVKDSEKELARRWRETGSFGPTATKPIVTKPKPLPEPEDVTPVVLLPEEVPEEVGFVSEDDETLDLLMRADLEYESITPESQGGVNESYRVGIGEGQEAIVKSGMEYFWDKEAQSEAWGYRMSEELGFGLVPPTVVRESGTYRMPDGSVAKDDASLQLWAENATAGWHLKHKQWDNVDPRQFSQMTLMDILSINSDRHNGNFMLTDDNQLVAVDNGAMFASTRKSFYEIGLERSLKKWIPTGKPLTFWSEDLDAIQNLVHNNPAFRNDFVLEFGQDRWDSLVSQAGFIEGERSRLEAGIDLQEYWYGREL